MAKVEKVDLVAALLTPEVAADMSQLSRLSPDNPRTIGIAMFLEIMSCILHGKIEVKSDALSKIGRTDRPLLESLPAKSRDFVRWSLDRLEHLAKNQDKDTAAVACEMLAGTLLFLQSWDKDHGVSYHSPFRNDKEEKEKAISKVLEYLRRAIELDPSRERAWELLTPLLVEMEKYEEATVVAKKRIERKDNAHNRFLLAKVYAEQDQFDKAAAQLRIGLKQEPEELDCRLGLIAVLLKRDDAAARKEAGEQLDAIEQRIKGEKSKSRGTNYLLLRGIHAALNDQPQRAKEVFKQVLQRDKERKAAVRALAALGEPLLPADEQMAMDYLAARGGEINRDEKQPGSPVGEVRLLDDKFTDADLFILTALPHLQRLDLSSTEITNAGLTHLKKLTVLRHLDLSCEAITDAGLAHLQGLTDLRELTLECPKLTDAGLAQLEAFRHLEQFRIGWFHEESITITEGGLAHLRKLPNLREVSLGKWVTDKGLTQLAAIPHLQTLYIIYAKITDEGMKQLERCTELRELWLCGTEITDAGLAHLKGLRQLQKLELSNTKITDAGLAHLRGLTNLRELNLDGANLFEGAMQQLKQLGFSPDEDTEKKPAKPRITDMGLKHLQGLTGLEELNLSGHPISDAGLAHLKALTNLRSLSINSSKVTDAGLQHIEHLTRLEWLILDRGRITDAGLVHLRALKRLKYVSLDGTKVTAKGVAELKKVCPKLEVSRR